MKSIQDIMREKLAQVKADTERRLTEIMAQPTDIEAEVQCMWEMILGKEGDYGDIMCDSHCCRYCLIDPLVD